MNKDELKIIESANNDLKAISIIMLVTVIIADVIALFTGKLLFFIACVVLSFLIWFITNATILYMRSMVITNKNIADNIQEILKKNKDFQ